MTVVVSSYFSGRLVTPVWSISASLAHAIESAFVNLRERAKPHGRPPQHIGAYV